MSDRYSHEGASDKFEAAIKGRGWKPAKRRRFHDWLTKNYPSQKDQFSDRELREKADQFASQDRDHWND